ncbi:MAG: hypothetical protein HY216_06350 [Candidatus Rokubacteria bacterium]|nr:hypothetical protein [Candidatus Eisenbacteria bacterium]MBI3635827.1 hypothetical protein [Candidatus Rokubacteria bacterium]
MSDGVAQLKWADLGAEDRERLLLIISTFEEFAAGYDHFTRLGERISAVEPLMRFLSGATFHWFYLLYRGDDTALPILRKLGYLDQIARAESLLDVRVGSASVGHFISEWRNKRLVHFDFTHKRVERALFRHFDATDPTTQEVYRKSMQALADLTVEIQQQLWADFPEAMDAVRSGWLHAATSQHLDNPSGQNR